MASAHWQKSLAKNLLAWFRREARDLPWRRTNDLYAIWISEIMLQQTQVATVIPYWQRFLARFPDVASLAAAEEQEVLRHWEGLGYYRRARQLHSAAICIVADHDAQFPIEYVAALALPGIGRYTAGAILSIGLDQRLPILEANTIRVLSRLTAYRGDVDSTAGRQFLWSTAEQLLPRENCGAFNQALMELGSEICTPRAPACDRCPVATVCQARQQNLVSKIPRPAKPTKYDDITEVALVIRRGRSVLLRHCQPGERWAGLWDFPRFESEPCDKNGALLPRLASQARDKTGLPIASVIHLTTLKHGVTRFRITLHCYEACLSRRAKVPSNGQHARWVNLSALSTYPLSTTGRQISRLLTPQTAPTSAAPPPNSRRRSC